MRSFYTQIKNIVDKSTKKIVFSNQKKDYSMLTNNDVLVQKNIVKIIKKYFPDVKQFICEENFELKKFNKIDFKEPFAIIDPIDGTENFYAENGMFGSLISVYSKLKGDIDIIYIPKYNQLITRDNIKILSKKPKKKNKICLMSTKCISEKKVTGTNFRVFGSSAFSFFQLIRGEANEFAYCGGAKIWDCYTGLRLIALTKCNISIIKNNWFKKPTFKTKFIAKWR